MALIDFLKNLKQDHHIFDCVLEKTEEICVDFKLSNGLLLRAIETHIEITQLLGTKPFPRNLHFLPSDTHMYV